MQNKRTSVHLEHSLRSPEAFKRTSIKTNREGGREEEREGGGGEGRRRGGKWGGGREGGENTPALVVIIATFLRSRD